MCGIAGVFASINIDSIGYLLEVMGGSIAHRGPDDVGMWCNKASNVGFVHRRLSIVDLSPAGHQPMISHSRRYTIVFNGEIYNYKQLRSVLESDGEVFSGNSDTEVLLSTIERYGLADALCRLNGMFAFALWDSYEQRLYLSRDRMGEKPLYYGWFDGVFVFASELKAVCKYPGFKANIDYSALDYYLRFNYVPAPSTIYSGLRKLPPGSFLELKAGCNSGDETMHTYWSLLTSAQLAITQRRDIDDGDYKDQFEFLLRDAVKIRMEADVPLGAFLSGGVDSSLIVALMQGQSSRPVNTFSIGFEGDEYDETQYAKAVANHLGTHHTSEYLSSRDAMNLVPEMQAIFDEPFADSSQIPALLVSRLTRRHVTVALTGDGGDELFGGYSRYALGSAMWRRIEAIPKPLRPLLCTFADAMSGVSNRLQLGGQPSTRRKLRTGTLSDKLEKASALLSSPTFEDMYAALLTTWRQPSKLLVNQGQSVYKMVGIGDAGWSLPQKMLFSDTVGYLSDDILVKLDRTSMAVSLEGRVPLLDHRIVEFAWTLPDSLRVGTGAEKRILKEILYKYVPKSMVDRPKMGFSIPINSWLRGDLREWAEDLLGADRLRKQGIFNEKYVQHEWHRFMSGANNSGNKIWNLLMFQSWYDRWCIK